MLIQKHSLNDKSKKYEFILTLHQLKFSLPQMSIQLNIGRSLIQLSQAIGDRMTHYVLYINLLPCMFIKILLDLM